jgi:hypothetical protein
VAFSEVGAWVSFASGQLGQLSREPFELLETYALSGAGQPRAPYDSGALAYTGKDRLWVVSASGGGQGAGVLTAFDTAHGTVANQLDLGLGPRARGDMSGSAVGGTLAPAAAATRVFRGCGYENTGLEPSAPSRPTVWQNVHVSAVVGPDAELEVSVRHAARESELAAASYQALGTLPTARSPWPLDFPADGVVEVRIALRALGALGAPRVAQVGVQWRCVGPE